MTGDLNEEFVPNPALFPQRHPAMPDSTPLDPRQPMVMIALDHAKYLQQLLWVAQNHGALGECGDFMDPTNTYCWICTALSQFDFTISNTEYAVEDGDTTAWNDPWPQYGGAPHPQLDSDKPTLPRASDS